MWFSRSTILINFCSLLTYHPRSYYWHTYVAFYIKSLMFIIGCSETEENDFLSPVLAFSASTPCSLVSSTSVSEDHPGSKHGPQLYSKGTDSATLWSVYCIHSNAFLQWTYGETSWLQRFQKLSSSASNLLFCCEILNVMCSHAITHVFGF
jgi:hypothetical protein